MASIVKSKAVKKKARHKLEKKNKDLCGAVNTDKFNVKGL